MKNITFSADTGHIPNSGSGTTGPFGGNASFILLDLPQVAGGILTGDRLDQMRAGLQGTAGLPHHISPPLSETWQWEGVRGQANEGVGTQRRIFRRAFWHCCTTAEDTTGSGLQSINRAQGLDVEFALCDHLFRSWIMPVFLLSRKFGTKKRIVQAKLTIIACSRTNSSGHCAL